MSLEKFLLINEAISGIVSISFSTSDFSSILTTSTQLFFITKKPRGCKFKPPPEPPENGYSVSFGIYLEPFFDVMNVKGKPVLYLKSDTKIIGGKGTYDEPYELGV